MMEALQAFLDALSGELSFVAKLLEVGAIAALGGFGMLLLYKLVKKLGVPFIQAQQEIAGAMGNLAAAVGDTKCMVSEMVGADKADHREIILTLQVLSDEVRQMREEVKNEN